MSDKATQLAESIADRLSDRYLADRVGIATICDERLDRSGNLLGWLREHAALRALEDKSNG